MKKSLFLLIALSSFLFSHQGNAQKTFNSFDEFMTYAVDKSISLSKRAIELSRAKRLKLASILGLVDPTGNISASYVNNTQLPVTLVPGELVGGTSGTIEEVQFGLQYESQFNSNIDLKLINLAGWSGMRLSKINLNLSENKNQLTRKDLYENAAIFYYNILTLQTQKRSVEANILSTDTINQIVTLRLAEGLDSQQDINNTNINLLRLRQSKARIDFNLEQQYNSLKVLCDIPDEEEIEIVPEVLETKPISIEILKNGLLFEEANLRQQYALSSFRQSRFQGAPTLSFIASNSRQKLSENSRPFDSDINWIPGAYIGLRLNIPIPGYRVASNHFKAKYDLELAEEDKRQAMIKMDTESSQLRNDYSKALTEERFNQSIYQLKKDTYEKNFMSYKEGVTDLNETLNSFQEMINAEYQWIASQLEIALNKTRITINNTIQ